MSQNEYLISGITLLISAITLYLILKKLLQLEKHDKETIQSKRRLQNTASMQVNEEKHNRLESEVIKRTLFKYENDKQIFYVKRSVVNIASIMKKLIYEVPTEVDIDCNFILDKLEFRTSKYISCFFEDLINESIAHNSTKIQIRHSLLKKSHKISFKDNRSNSHRINLDLLESMAKYDSEFTYYYKSNSNKFSVEIDLYFNKYNGKTKIGRFYTLKDIELNYGSEILDNVKLNRNEVLRYINVSHDYMLFKLKDNKLDVGKTVEGKRHSLINNREIGDDIIYRILSKEFIFELIQKTSVKGLSFENRRNNEGKVTFVISNGEKYLQTSWPCPEFCENRLNDILH